MGCMIDWVIHEEAAFHWVKYRLWVCDIGEDMGE